MSRTYIGPFGTILPLPEGKEPERQQLPDDETRTSMATYQLPPPDRLQFGSDTSPGFTEPTRYNAISQSSRSHAPSNLMYAEHNQHARHLRQEQLPSVRHLLTPSSQSTVPQPPFPPQRSPNSPEQAPNLASDHRGQTYDQAVRPSEFSHQSTHSQSQLSSTQMPPPSNVNSLRKEYQISPSPSQQFRSSYMHHHQGTSMSPYAPSIETSQHMSYTSQYPQALPPELPQHQQMASQTIPLLQQAVSLSPTHPQQILAVNAPPHYYVVQPCNRKTAISSEKTLEHNPPSTANSIKPLPRAIGESDVPGEGPSWVYEDGTTCKKIIDGEEVNAQWGVTKAGKPRKRLAVACTTCREKKIKCDPAEPKCIQCEKFSRECRFTTAFRFQRGSPDSPSYDSQARAPLVTIKSELWPVLVESSPDLGSSHVGYSKPLKRRNSPPESRTVKSIVLSDIKPNKATVAKRQRSSLPGLTVSEAERKCRLLKMSQSDPEAQYPGEGEPATVDSHPFRWCNDPFEIDGTATSHYLEAYFTHINNATYRMFPAKPFMRWARHSERKSPEDLMTVYALLAVGSIFSSRVERNLEGSLFAKVAKFAVEKSHGKFSLQLTHSRLLLAWYHFAIGDAQKSWDYGGMAIRSASGLKLNLERDCQDAREIDELGYGLNKYALAECHRRAFWSAYMTDRFSGFCSGHLCMIQSEDVYLRLPCQEKIYEEQNPVETPYFDNGLVDQKCCRSPSPESSNLGSMAFSVQVTSIWSDVLTNIFRSSHASQSHYAEDFQSFHRIISQRLASWMKALPAHLTRDDKGLKASICDGSVGCFTSMQAVYYTAILKLNRNIRHALLPASAIACHVRTAVSHASQLLQLIRTIGTMLCEYEASCSMGTSANPLTECAFSSPFVGYAVLTSIDVLSASGSLECCLDTITLMEGSLVAFDRLNKFWTSAKVQSKSIRRRIEQLVAAVNSKPARNKRAWRFSKPLDASLDRGQDVFYDNEDRLGALGHIARDLAEEDILLVD